MPGPYPLEQTVAYDFDALVVTNGAAVALTTAKINSVTNGPCTRAYVTVASAQVRYRYDGTSPTTAVGHIANAGDVLTFEGPQNVVNLKFIATTVTNAEVDVSYEAA